MAVYNTTDAIESSMFLKAKTPRNMVMENEYIYDLQQRRDADWEYRTNVVDIEEELEKPLEYGTTGPKWSWTDAVIQTAYSDTGIRLSDDWRVLVFRSIQHPYGLGYRYRFSYDFERYANSPKEDRHEEGSVWIGVNSNTPTVGSNVVIRRCQTNVGFGGVKSIVANTPDEKDYVEILETHYEPVIIENQMTADFKAINKYSNEVVSLPQAELYMIFQANYYTRFIGINDRFIVGNTFGASSSEFVRNFTSVFEVKAVKEAPSTRTFAANSEMDVTYTPLIYVALDKALEAPGDNMATRLAEHCPLYLVPTQSTIPTTNYALAFDEGYKTVLLLGSNQTFLCKMYDNGTVIPDVDYTSMTFVVNGAAGTYSYVASGNSITVTNLKKSSTALTVTAAFTYNGTEYTTATPVTITLGGFS